MDMGINYVSYAALALGSFLLISGALGILRFPDFYTRMHAASVTDTSAVALILVGLMLQAGWGLVLFKLILIGLFIMFTSPTSTHALAKSAQHGQLDAKLSRRED